jgi:hypothetical protein
MVFLSHQCWLIRYNISGFRVATGKGVRMTQPIKEGKRLLRDTHTPFSSCNGLSARCLAPHFRVVTHRSRHTPRFRLVSLRASVEELVIGRLCELPRGQAPRHSPCLSVDGVSPRTVVATQRTIVNHDSLNPLPPFSSCKSVSRGCVRATSIRRFQRRSGREDLRHSIFQEKIVYLLWYQIINLLTDTHYSRFSTVKVRKNMI